MGFLRTFAGLAAGSGYLGLRARRLRPVRTLSVTERLRNIPTRDAPVSHTVRILWNEHQVPFIEAETDRDLAVALGVVHAHLRLAQIEFMRRAARGRLAEVLGPLAVEIDRFLRTLHLDRAVPRIIDAMPPETREWLEGFAAGINHVIAKAPKPVVELDLLGIRPEPWTVADLLAIGRLSGADFTWRMWFSLLRHQARPEWMKLWQRMMSPSPAPLPSFSGGGAPVDALSDRALSDWACAMLGRAGSNSVAVSRARSATGAALIASDPHLPIVLPNTWLMAGYRSPGYHAVGLMIPGVPAMALGRNEHIAWGGTSLHAASSELFDVSDRLGAEHITERQDTIRVRWWRDEAITIRETRFGPVLTDAAVFRAPEGKTLALRWVGHRPSDEISALLGVNRARNWREFHDALESFAVPAQNMIYADVDGAVGQAMAAHLPRRPRGAPADIIAGEESHLHWDAFVTARDLPSVCTPPEGFVASANNKPTESDVPVGFFFSPDDRIGRLRDHLASSNAVSIASLIEMQHDVLVPSAVAVRDALLTFIHALPPGIREDAAVGRLLAAVEQWDGRYDAASNGAIAFEFLIYHFLRELNGEEDLAVYAAFSDPWQLVREDLETIEQAKLAAALERATPLAARAVARFGTWGDVHRLRLLHVFGRIPLIGRHHVHVDAPVGGSNETVMKTAHGLSAKRHAVRFGANARHISDLSDPDHNWLVLLGGQDGWIGSSTFIDQYDLWRRRALVHLPLRPETVRRLFPHRMELKPCQSNAKP
jgi:penicillin G amidase